MGSVPLVRRDLPALLLGDSRLSGMHEYMDVSVCSVTSRDVHCRMRDTRAAMPAAPCPPNWVTVGGFNRDTREAEELYGQLVCVCDGDGQPVASRWEAILFFFSSFFFWVCCFLVLCLAALLAFCFFAFLAFCFACQRFFEGFLSLLLFAALHFLFFAGLRFSIFVFCCFFRSASALAFCFWACFLLMPCLLFFSFFKIFAFSFLRPAFPFCFSLPLATFFLLLLVFLLFLERSKDYRKKKNTRKNKRNRYGAIEQRIQYSRTTKQSLKGESKKKSKGE